MTLYHNPRCRKSRETLALLNEQGVDPEIRLYLEEVPSKTELKSVVKKLAIGPAQLIRTGEKDYKENFKGKELTDNQWIDAMIDYPKLIERPILINGDKAAIGRPPENVLSIIG